MRHNLFQQKFWIVTHLRHDVDSLFQCQWQPVHFARVGWPRTLFETVTAEIRIGVRVAIQSGEIIVFADVNQKIKKHVHLRVDFLRVS